jgi:hypothetical protein
MKTIWISGTIFNYEDLSELTNALQNAHCQLGNHAMLGDGVRLGNVMVSGLAIVRINYVTLGMISRLVSGLAIGNVCQDW